MAKRKRIALVYSYNEKWIGGTYYIENLINAIKTLPESELPELQIVASKDAFKSLKSRVDYPYFIWESEYLVYIKILEILMFIIIYY